MGKNKLKKFDDLNNFSNVIQPKIEELKKDYLHKGLWRRNIFKNNNEICLELGCGKGEYTVELAKRNPHINYIGIDIKGARIRMESLMNGNCGNRIDLAKKNCLALTR